MKVLDSQIVIFYKASDAVCKHVSEKLKTGRLRKLYRWVSKCYAYTLVQVSTHRHSQRDRWVDQVTEMDPPKLNILVLPVFQKKWMFHAWAASRSTEGSLSLAQRPLENPSLPQRLTAFGNTISNKVGKSRSGLSVPQTVQPEHQGTLLTCLHLAVQGSSTNQHDTNEGEFDCSYAFPALTLGLGIQHICPGIVNLQIYLRPGTQRSSWVAAPQ